MYCVNIKLLRMLPLSVFSSSSDHSEGPLSPFSVLKSWQSHSETCAKEEAWAREAWGGRCYVTLLSLTEAPLYQRSSVAEVQLNVDIKKLLKETRKR